MKNEKKKKHLTIRQLHICSICAPCSDLIDRRRSDKCSFHLLEFVHLVVIVKVSLHASSGAKRRRGVVAADHLAERVVRNAVLDSSNVAKAELVAKRVDLNSLCRIYEAEQRLDLSDNVVFFLAEA